jgi:sugar phosphate isomerase/epimerase
MAVKVSVTVCLIPEAKGGPFVLWDDLPSAARLASELGFDAIELFPPEPDALNPNEVKTLLAKLKLAVSAVGSGAGWVRHKLSLTHSDAAHRERAREFVRAMIDFAAKLGAPVIIGSMQGRWGDGVDKLSALAFLAESLNDLGNHAASRRQILLYEPLNRYETNLINTIDDGLAFLRRLQTSNVKLMADLFHMNIEEANIGDAIRAGGKHIGHVHFADSNRRPAGLGHIDFNEVVAALREIGYDGYLAAEALPYPNPEAAARQTVKRFRELTLSLP